MSLSSTRRMLLLAAGGLIAKSGIAGDGGDSANAGEALVALSARQILERMAATYAGCHSYRDSGRVTTAFLGDGEDRSSETTFSTAFVRPARFRFEFSTRGFRYLIGASDDAARSWWSIRSGIQTESSLDLALAGATGISSSTAHTVPVLLMPDRVSGSRLTDRLELERLEDAKLGEVDCFRVQGVTRFDRDPEQQERSRQQVLKVTGRDPGIATADPTVLWIDRSTFMLRRIDTRTRHASYRTESTTVYEPALNAAIADSLLTFDPPTS